jgi:hypothetical protein
MDKITLPINLLNAIMGYLGKQPYDQVYQLIAEVQKEAQAQTPPPQE